MDVTLKELQEKEVEMFKILIDVCERMNIRYYLIGGTLLGAVRHKGFIPWDDDIDIGMMRPDFEKFTHEAQKLFPDNYFVQTYETDPGYSRNFAKLRNSNTTFIESNNKKSSFNQGIYIDIFPLDYYPESAFSAKWLNLRKDFYMAKISEAFDLGNLQEGIAKRWSRKIIRRIVPSVQLALKKRDAVFKSVKNSKLIANYEGNWGMKEVVPAEWFGNGIELEFEGMKVRGVKNYDAYLRHVYGNYMELPPVEKRVTHHETHIIDLHQSYKKYL